MLRIPSWIKRNPFWSIASLSVVAIVGLNQAKERSLWIQGSAAKGSDQIVGKIDRTVNDSFTQSTPNSASLAQSMRQEFNSIEQCYEQIKPNIFGGKFKYCVKGGKVLFESGKLEGYIGKKFSNDGKIQEWLIENGKLVRYRCFVSGYKYDCGDIDREVFVKTKSRQEVEEFKRIREKFYKFFDSGNAKLKLGDNQGAISDYTKAISVNSKRVDIYLAFANRGNAKLNLQDYRGAISDFDKAIGPDTLIEHAYSIFYKRGSAKYFLKDYKGAISDIDKAIKTHPKHPKIYEPLNDIAWNNYLLGDFESALMYVNKAAAIVSDHAVILDTRGRIKHALGKDRSACDDLTKASSLGNNDTSTYLKSSDGAWCRNME